MIMLLSLRWPLWCIGMLIWLHSQSTLSLIHPSNMHLMHHLKRNRHLSPFARLNRKQRLADSAALEPDSTDATGASGASGVSGASGASGAVVVEKPWTERDAKRLDKQISKVALPALAAAVVEPALTMIDMYFVGTQQNQALATAGLAGLSVTGAIFNIIAACTYPLCSGTTAVVSRAQGKYEGDNPGTADSKAISKEQKRLASPLGNVLINGLVLGLLVGCAFGLFLMQYSTGLLNRAFTLDADVFGITDAYIKIRGSTLPFALMSYVLIGFCLSVQDVASPLLSIAASSVVNIIGDFVMVNNLKMGLVGAAIATALATAVGALLLLVRLLPRYVKFDRNRTLRSNIGTWWGAIDVPRMRQYFETSVALLAGMVANTLTYSAGAKISTYVAGSRLSNSRTVHVAGHQIAMQIWWFLSYFNNMVSVAAQAILPRDLKRGNLQRVNKAIDVLLRQSLWVAGFCTLANTGFLKLFPDMFTSSAEVQNAFLTVLPQVALSQFFISLVTCWDGFLIGTDRVPSYVFANVVGTVSAWTYYIFIAIRRGLGLEGTWNGLLIFSATRFAFHISRMLNGTFRKFNTRNMQIEPLDDEEEEDDDDLN